ncbi:MAG: hypothetical protein H9802_16275 [Candidatus Phocaeicola faecipullorum]|nr:hypothetical protein [Candidatus Phocaeicola faecipullorum]
MCSSKWTPAQTGKQGLFRLVKQAYELYKTEVIPNKKSYRRYMLDFIHSTRYHDATDAWSKNEHQKNYYTVVALLREHEELAHKYFVRPTLGKVEISLLLDEFYAADLPQRESASACKESPNRHVASPGNIIKPLLDRHTIDLIVQLANEVNLFKEQMNADDVASRYMAGTLQPVTSRNNTRLVILLDKLAMYEIIPYNWQAIISKRKLIISSSGRKFLNQHDLSSTLNRVKDTQPGLSEKKFMSVIDGYIERIKSRKVN